MFWTVFPSIIRSSKLRIQQWYKSNSCWQLFDLYRCCMFSLAKEENGQAYGW